MARKRLVDLLREEAQKSLEQEDAAVTAANSEELPEDEINTEELSTVTDSTNSNTKRTSPTKAELEATITELRAALQEVQDHEMSLQQKVAELQSELKDYKTLVQKLQAESEQANQVKAELEQAKTMILQLSQPISPPAPKTQPISPPTPTSQSEMIVHKRDTRSLKSQRSAFPTLPNYPEPSTQHSELSDADVGWFD